MASRSLAMSRSAAGADSSTTMATRKTTRTTTYKQDGSGNMSTEVHTHVDNSSDMSVAVVRRLEEKIRVLQDDYESEAHLRHGTMRRIKASNSERM